MFVAIIATIYVCWTNIVQSSQVLIVCFERETIVFVLLQLPLGRENFVAYVARELVPVGLVLLVVSKALGILKRDRF